MKGNGEDKVERSESGSPIYRYDEPERGPDQFEAPHIDAEAIERIEQHIEKYVGMGDGASFVWHEIISDLVHIDVHVIPPTAARNYYTLVTTGMSDRPMNTPQEAAEFRYAELMLCLPPDWPLVAKAGGILSDEESYWPVRLLKFLARFPHDYNTWLGFGHTIPNGDPPAPLADDTDFCCALILAPVLFSPEFLKVDVREDKTVHILSVVPIYREELDFKLKYGADALLERFDQHGVNELLVKDRVNVCKDAPEKRKKGRRWWN